MKKHNPIDNAKKRGFSLELEDMIEHLKGECIEFLKGRDIDPKILGMFPEDYSDAQFLSMYQIIKDSKIDELADLRIIPNTIASVLGIDLDKAERLKNRYNALRD